MRWLLVAFAVLLLAIGLWILDHLRPRHGHFVTQRGELASATVTESDLALAGFRSAVVRVRATTDLEVGFRVLRPENATGPLPLVVLIGGHRTGSRALEMIGNPGPIVVAALDYPYHGPEKLRGWRQILDNVDDIQDALLDTPPAVSLAVDWLVDQPWVDPARVELVGVSLGVPFATVAGALDDRFRRVWLMHGGADNREWLAGALRHSIASPRLRSSAAWFLHLLVHGASFDTEFWIEQIAPRPVIIVGAAEDESLTRENIVRLHDAADPPKELHWTEGGHVQPKHPEIVRALLDLVRNRMRSELSPAD